MHVQPMASDMDRKNTKIYSLSAGNNVFCFIMVIGSRNKTWNAARKVKMTKTWLLLGLDKAITKMISDMPHITPAIVANNMHFIDLESILFVPKSVAVDSVFTQPFLDI